jgi:hypothetical protein
MRCTPWAASQLGDRRRSEWNKVTRKGIPIKPDRFVVQLHAAPFDNPYISLGL